MFDHIHREEAENAGDPEEASLQKIANISLPCDECGKKEASYTVEGRDLSPDCVPDDMAITLSVQIRSRVFLHETSAMPDQDTIRPLEDRPEEYSEWTTPELKDSYGDIIQEAADRGSVGLSFGSQVMEASPIKRELNNRGESV